MIGTALDMRAAGNAFVSVSVNGSFAPPISVAFSGITAPHLSPASSSFGLHLVNFGHGLLRMLPPAQSLYRCMTLAGLPV
jgi:hypothetical protein